MATVALGLAGAALGPALAGAGAAAAAIATATAIASGVGAALGSIIDTTLLYPTLFPRETPEGPRLGELRIQNQEEGAFGNFAVGTHNRVASTLIWVSDVVEVKNEEEVGGKGGFGETTIITYSYYVSLACAFAIQRGCTVRRILADGKVIYDNEGDISVTSNQLSVQPFFFGLRMRINSPAGGPDLSRFISGRDIVVSGFSNPNNNGTFRCTSSGRNNATGTSYVYVKNASAVSESAGASVTLTQDIEHYDEDQIRSVTNYDGTQATADPVIEAHEGAGNVPSFKGTSFTVLEFLKLDDFGRRIPQLNFVISTPDGTASTAVDAIMIRSGRATDDFDVAGLSGSVKGYSVQGPISTVEALQPLLIAYDVVTQEGNAKLRFFHRKDATIIDVAAEDLAAHESGSDTPRVVDITDPPDASLPAEVDVKHLDSENEEQYGSQRQRHPGYRTDGVDVVNLPVVMHGGTARAISRRLLWMAWANRNPMKLSLPLAYYYVQENDVLRFFAYGNLWLALVTRVDHGANGLVLIDCVLEVRSVLTQSEDYEAKTDGTGPVSFAPYVEHRVFETPPLNPTGTVTNTPVIGNAVGIEEEVPWPGVRIYVAPEDEEEDYVTLAEALGESVMGGAESILASATPYYWDRVNTVDVYVMNGTLESREEGDVLNGANRALLGTEIIGFATATLIGTNTYRLSTLLRGLRDTVDQMGSHATAEQFVLLNAGVGQTTVNAGWIGTTRYFRAVPGGGAIADYAASSLVIQGTSLRPFAPTALAGSRDGSGNLTLSWVRRTRAVYEIFGTATAPLAEDVEKYDLEVWYSGTKKRSVTVTEATSFVYTAAMHTEDGVPSFATVEARVYQLSAVVGRGKGLTGNV